MDTADLCNGNAFLDFGKTECVQKLVVFVEQQQRLPLQPLHRQLEPAPIVLGGGSASWTPGAAGLMLRLGTAARKDVDSARSHSQSQDDEDAIFDYS